MTQALNWLYRNWYYSTIFLAIFVLIFSMAYILDEDMALFLIWMQTVVYFVHQFEEYVLPGGFVEFFNREMLGSTSADFPLDSKASFWINIPIIFVAFPISALLSGIVGFTIGLWTAYFSLINALSHVGMSLKVGYNPGLIVSTFLNIPVSLFTIYYFISNGISSITSNLTSFLIALLVQITLMIYGFRVLKPRAK